MTFKEYFQIMAGYNQLYCNSKASCNSFVSIEEACKNAKQLVYNPKKDNGYFNDSGAVGLVAITQILATVSLALISS